MRGAKSLLFLLVVLAGLGAYLYFVEMKREPGDAPEKREKVFAVEAEKIDELTIKSESGDQTRLKKTGSDWQVVVPADGGPTAVDAPEVSGITTNLATLEQQRVIDENPQDLKEFGLDAPRVEVTFKAGGPEQTLQLGAKTPTGSDLYAKVAGKPKVFLISSFLESTFNKKTFDLRDKTALKVDSEKVDAIEVTTADRTLKFGKVNGAWQLVSPAESRTDAVTINNAVSRLTSAQMKSMVPETNLAEFGLDKPSATIRVGTGSSQATLLIGKTAEEGSVYAKDASRPGVFTLDAAMVDELKKEPAEYRQKDLFDVRAFNAAFVEATRGGQTFGAQKDGDKWKSAPGAGAQKELDTAKVEALLSAITGARATSFVAKAPTGKPDLVVAVKPQTGAEERVSFYKQGSDLLAVRSGSSGAAKVDPPLLDDIVKALEALK
jgi:hypothetical protein